MQPGQLITGAGIPAGARVISAANGVFSEETTGVYTATSAVVTSIPSTAGFEVGMTVTGVGPATGAVILSVDSSSQITMSLPAISGDGVTPEALDVSGGGTITISVNATATTTNVALAITGGSPSNPLWGAGNTNTNPLSSVPAWVGSSTVAPTMACRITPCFPIRLPDADQLCITGFDGR